jgi:hypothetical protein
MHVGGGKEEGRVIKKQGQTGNCVHVSMNTGPTAQGAHWFQNNTLQILQNSWKQYHIVNQMTVKGPLQTWDWALLKPQDHCWGLWYSCLGASPVRGPLSSCWGPLSKVQNGKNGGGYRGGSWTRKTGPCVSTVLNKCKQSIQLRATIYAEVVGPQKVPQILNVLFHAAHLWKILIV